MHIDAVPKEYYALNAKDIRNAHFEMFKTYNIGGFILYGFIYLIFIYKTFYTMLKQNFSIRKLLFLFPLALCFLGIDYFRWYCFVFFLVMLFNIYYTASFDKKIFRNILYFTILFGIPVSIETKFGLVNVLFHFISKIL
jgi:hypothetical protein